MIEFIIPLNLPIRAVTLTEANASPPERVRAEIDRFKRRKSPLSTTNPLGSHRYAQAETSTTSKMQDEERERELDQLRSQQDLFRRAVAELKHATTVYQKRVDGLVQEFQTVAVELAEAISAKLVFGEINANRFPIANLVHEVINRLETNSSAVVKFHPDDLAQLQSLEPIEDPEHEQEQMVQFVADPSLSRGDCKAKAGEITVVYELRRQIEEIRRKLLSTVNGHAEP